MAFNVNMNNFVIDRVLRGLFLDSGNGDVLFSLNQIQNPSLTVSSESSDAVDALGTPIATFYRAKNAEFSAENALFDMNLMAAQSGSTVTRSGAIEVPVFKEILAADYATTSIPAIDAASGDKRVAGSLHLYEMNGDGTLGAEVDLDTDAMPAQIPNANAIGYLAYYNVVKPSGKAIELANYANKFPTAGKFVMEVLGCNVCDQTELIYAYIIFPNAKLSPDFDWSIATDSTHPFSMKAMQDYCSPSNKLFSIVIAE